MTRTTGLAPRFAVGLTARDLRQARRVSGEVSIAATATDAGLSYSQLQRMEHESDNFDAWLTKFDMLAATLGISLGELIELSRLRGS